MGIYPFDQNAIPISAFEPAKNMTTQVAQPLPARLSSLLTPIPSPAASAAPSSHSLDVGTPVDDRSDPVVPELSDTDPVVDGGVSITIEPEPMQRYTIQVPPLLPNLASQKALRAENMML